MVILFFLLFSFILLLISTLKGYLIIYPLLISMAILIAILTTRGYSIIYLMRLAFASSKKSFLVINILLSIGAVIAIWMSAGTIPIIVYYGTKFIQPQYFIFSAFLFSSLVSILIGTSIGTVSTIGIALMIMSRGSDVNTNIIAGAIIAGAYFGDRCSPMSSSAHLVATITETKINHNLKNMAITTFYPFMIAIIFYLIFSFTHPVYFSNNNISNSISTVFNLNLITLSPALIILVLGFLQVEIKIAMLISIIIGFLISIFSQGYSFSEVIRFMIMGFELEGDNILKPVITGGGIISMVKVSIIVIVSTAFAGIFAGTKILESVDVYLKRIQSRGDLFLGTTIVGVASAAFGCTQTIAILLTQELIQEKYQEKQIDNYQLALDLENTVVVLSPLIPWNIAGLVPANILMTDFGFIPYAFYLYMIPVFNFFRLKMRDKSVQK